MSYSQDDAEAPENWEEIDTTENIIQQSIDIKENSSKKTTVQPKIIRTDLDDHTPFKPSVLLSIIFLLFSYLVFIR